MPTPVTAVAAADSTAAAAHFSSLLSFETDCWDVHESLADQRRDFVLLDVRSPPAFAQAHVAGADSAPHARITAESMRAYPAGTLFVVYCAGPHCNGAHRAAIRLANLGRPVKIMIGGIAGWLDEGFALEKVAE
jgi:rhodanese-related sulfurtransferase